MDFDALSNAIEDLKLCQASGEPLYRLYMQRARLCIEQKKFDEAISDFDAAATFKGSSSQSEIDILLGKCFCLKRCGKFEESLQFIENLLKIHPNHQAAKKEKELLLLILESAKNETTFEINFLNQNQNRSPSRQQRSSNADKRKFNIASTPNELAESYDSSSESECSSRTNDDGDWQFRSPPNGVLPEEVALCHRSDQCPLKHDCPRAHSTAELEEWRNRLQQRQRRDEQPTSVMNEKDTAYLRTLRAALLPCLPGGDERDSGMIIRDCESVAIEYLSCQETVVCPHKVYECSWRLQITTSNKLRSVALLVPEMESHFWLRVIAIDNRVIELNEGTQIWLSTEILYYPTRSSIIVEVGFQKQCHGTYRQWLVLGFHESPPYVARELSVLPGEITSILQLPEGEIIAKTAANQWTEQNVIIVRFHSDGNGESLDGDTEDAHDNDASGVSDGHDRKHTKMNQYAIPDDFLHQTIRYDETKAFKMDSYREKMHNLLYLEEMYQISKIQTFGNDFEAKVVNHFTCTSGNAVYTREALDRELFVRINIERHLNPDHPGGRLLARSVSTVLLQRTDIDLPEEAQKVYECPLEWKQWDTMYFRVSHQCSWNLQLTVDSVITVKVQFQMNREPFRLFHAALDRIHSPHLIQPVQFPAMQWSPQRYWDASLPNQLNQKQKDALLLIDSSAEDDSKTCPPLLLLGPYGTGKTFTVAMAMLHLLKSSPESTRILVCTHSNSAADLYVKDYLDNAFQVEGLQSARPLRIYYAYRWIQTVDPVVIKYCLISNQVGKSAFRYPTREEVENHRVVVTTLSTCQYLLNCGLEAGFFSHIFIDEAAQALQCECLVPLALAGPKTRVILAGDPKQLSPEVFSPSASGIGLGASLLERLAALYPPDSVYKIILNENYRQDPLLMDLVSKLFYEKRLVCRVSAAASSRLHPVQFYVTQGEEQFSSIADDYYNKAEMLEVVERVQELVNVWPSEWGTFHPGLIGVLTPYADQVGRIRQELKERNLGMVTVERVLNVQGKQFRAVFISTVRTHRGCVFAANDALDYGLLSDPRLLNTAMTRAKSFVGFVGDPVSLRLIGQCRKLWSTIVEHCIRKKTFFGMTEKQFRDKINCIELKRKYGMDPSAPLFRPNVNKASSHTDPKSYYVGNKLSFSPPYPMGPGNQFVHPFYYQQQGPTMPPGNAGYPTAMPVQRNVGHERPPSALFHSYPGTPWNQQGIPANLYYPGWNGMAPLMHQPAAAPPSSKQRPAAAPASSQPRRAAAPLAPKVNPPPGITPNVPPPRATPASYASIVSNGTSSYESDTTTEQ